MATAEPSTQPPDGHTYQPYSYESFQSKRHIRLLRLLSKDTVRREVYGILEEISLDDHPQFDALSYTWGPATRLVQEEGGPPYQLHLWVHDVCGAEAKQQTHEDTSTNAPPRHKLYTLAIQENLAHALEALVDVLAVNAHQCTGAREDVDVLWQSGRISQKSSPTLWIDAICINQADGDERQHQISLMCDIFSSAKSVIVWLGRANQHSDIACWFHDTLLPDLEELLSKFLTQGDKIDFLRRYNPLDPHFWELTGYNPDVYDKYFWTKSWYFYLVFWGSCTWFDRVWVMQEVALARSIRVLCGSRWLSWDNMSKFGTYIQNALWFHDAVTLTEMAFWEASVSDKRPRGLGRGTNPTGTLDYLMRFTRNDPQNAKDAFAAYLLEALNRNCCRPEDRIYGISGIIERCGGREITERFVSLMKLDVVELSKAVSAFLYMNLSQGACFFAKGVCENGSTTHLSWVMDLNPPRDDSGYRKRGYTMTRGIFCASNGAKGNVLVRDDILHLRGLLVGHISHCSTYQRKENSLSQCLLELHKPFRMKKRRKTWFDVVQKTLVLGSITREFGEAAIGLLDEFPNSLKPLIEWEMVFPPKHMGQDALAEYWQRFGAALFESLDTRYDQFSEMVAQSYHDFQHAMSHKTKDEYFQDIFKAKRSTGYARLTTLGENDETFFLTKQGYLGVSQNVNPGDEIWIIAGFKVPVILRSAGQGYHFYVNEAYVDGIMYGELAKELSENAQTVMLK